MLNMAKEVQDEVRQQDGTTVLHLSEGSDSVWLAGRSHSCSQCAIDAACMT